MTAVEIPGSSKTVRVGGCQSWYLYADSILWPYTWERWDKEMAMPCMKDFVNCSFDPEPAEMAA